MKESLDLKMPSWEALLPSMLAVLENPKASLESKQFMQDELLKIARFADGHRQS